MPDTSSGQPPRTGSGRSCLTGIMLFVVGLVLCGMILILPTAFIGPAFVLGGLLLVMVIGLHYLVWGRWLTRILREEEEADID